MSTNRSPIGSRYTRKENYESLNYPSSFQSVSPLRPTYLTSQDHSANKKSIQQKQIEDLQQKVDLILEHNDKLVIENTDLKKRLNEAEVIGNSFMQKQRLSRYQQAEESQYAVRRINSELLIKNREIENIISQFQAFREITSKEGESMKEIINNLTTTNETLKDENAKLVQQLVRLKEGTEGQIQMAVRAVERKRREDLQAAHKEKEEQIAREKNYNDKVIQELSQKFEEQRSEWQNRKNILIGKLQDNHSKEINELREQMDIEYKEAMQNFEMDSNERCKNERDKADKFIKEFMQAFNPGNESQNESLRHEIKMLQQSLDNRKKFIFELTTNEINRQDVRNILDEAVLMRDRLKEQINHLMRENQLLKIKTAEKYEIDLKEMVKIYEDKIEVLSVEVRNLSDQNDRLRHNYEDEVSNRIRQRRNWEIQVGQLKNVVRKLKAEMQGIQDQFRLNIDGVRDQSATFSMAMMKSMIQDKEKANFFQEQNRKLRAMYDKHEAEVVVQKKQAQQKVKYYENKIEHLKKLINQEKEELNRKEEMLQNKCNEREENLREEIKREREHMQETIFQVQEQKQGLQKELIDYRQRCSEYQLDLKEMQSEIDRLNSKIKQNQEYIERLRMEVEMAGTDDNREETLTHWKEHYEGIILKLEDDKKELKAMIESQNKRIEQLVYKYRLVEEELKKASVSLSLKGDLDRKVMRLGLDENLIKNMGQLWANRSREPSP